MRFSHPLHASICYQRAPLWKRRAVHRALAAAVSDVEERARHLALAVEGPDAAVAAELDVAAEHAAARGATAAGAELFELAAELDPADAEASRQRGCGRPGCIGWPATANGRRRSWSSCSPRRLRGGAVPTSCSNLALTFRGTALALIELLRRGSGPRRWR